MQSRAPHGLGDGEAERAGSPSRGRRSGRGATAEGDNGERCPTERASKHNLTEKITERGSL